jgi:hypothetical protein
MENLEKALVVSQSKKIRRTCLNDKRCFSVFDILKSLTESKRTRKYWFNHKRWLTEVEFKLSKKIGQLKLICSEGKSYSSEYKNFKKLSNQSKKNIAVI